MPLRLLLAAGLLLAGCIEDTPAPNPEPDAIQDVTADEGGDGASADAVDDTTVDAVEDVADASVDGAGTDADADAAVDDTADASQDGTAPDADAEVEAEVQGPFCGDAECDAATEDATSCPVDCGGNAATLCLRDRCEGPLDTCIADAGCVTIFECLIGCDDTPCAQGCYLAASGDPEGTALMSAAITCGQNAGCFDGCGNGTCDADEDPLLCPQDCAVDCIATSCASQVAACEAIDGCPTLLDCWGACDSYSCQTACIQAAPPQAIAALQAIEACAGVSGCLPDTSCGDTVCADDEDEISCPEDCAVGPICGDGSCDLGETPSSCPQDCQTTVEATCAGKCGGYNPDWPCQCDPQCNGYGDCCMDVFDICGLEFCGDGQCTGDETFDSCPTECTAPAVCDDGMCEGDETPDTCPQDCPVMCGDGLCSAGETVANCEADCGPLSCLNKCDQPFTQGLPCQCDAECNANADCCQDVQAQCGLDFCGDGQCTGAENPTSCPAECSAECGDDTCEFDETVDNCFADCFSACMAPCTTEQDACYADVDCNGALKSCIPACAGDATCSAACGDGFGATSVSLVNGVVSCGVTAGCLQ